jgi:DNA modification methylase
LNYSNALPAAAKAEGFHAVGIEREAEYVAIIKARVGA